MEMRNYYDTTNEELFTTRIKNLCTVHGGNIALKGKDRQFTYSQMDKITELIGQKLIEEAGVKAGDVVVVRVERPTDVMLCIIGVWKARGVFAYIDERNPPLFNDYIMNNCNRKFIMDQDFIDPILENYDRMRAKQLPPGELSDRAFIIFTSGSTGTPKGVVVQQGSIAAQDLLRFQFGLQPSDSQSLLGAFSFMSILFQAFPLLSAGGTLCMPEPEERKSLDAMVGYFTRNKVTVAFMPPHLGRQMVKRSDIPPTFRLMICGGENVHSMASREYKIMLAYGSSEAGCVCTSDINYYASEDEGYPMVRPSPHMRLYVMTKEGKQAGPGEEGMLCIAGPQLCERYLDLEEANKEKFIDNPFTDEPRYKRLYRSGDILRVDENRTWFYVRREDLMVNIKGFRIELMHVESVMNQHPCVTRSIVKPYRPDGADIDSLCLYYIADGPQDHQDMRRYLQDRLPHYMIPNRYIYLKELPLNDNAKVDRKALAHPDNYK